MTKDTERALKLFIVLSRASKVILEEAHKPSEKHGLNPTEFAVLELLHHRGRQPIQKIGQKILLRSGSMTYVVDKLEKRGLLERVFCEEDKRVTYMSITPAGIELMTLSSRNMRIISNLSCPPLLLKNKSKPLHSYEN